MVAALSSHNLKNVVIDLVLKEQKQQQQQQQEKLRKRLQINYHNELNG